MLRSELEEVTKERDYWRDLCRNNLAALQATVKDEQISVIDNPKPIKGIKTWTVRQSELERASLKRLKNGPSH